MDDGLVRADLPHSFLALTRQSVLFNLTAGDEVVVQVVASELETRVQVQS